MVLPLLTCSHYNTFLIHRNSSSLVRFFLSCNANYNIAWSILERAGSYSNTSKRCNLCLAEAFHSLFADKHPSLNQKD